MKKGGYKIIDFKGTALSDTAVEIPGIFNQIVDDYNKAILVSGVILSGELQDDAYASVKGNDGSVDLTVYGGVITVTEDDEVTFATAKSNAELTELVTELQTYKVIVETGTDSTTIASKLATLRTGFTSLTAEQKTKSFIKGGSLIYNLNSVNGVYVNISGTAERTITDIIGLGASTQTLYEYIFRTTGTTITDLLENTSNTNFQLCCWG